MNVLENILGKINERINHRKALVRYEKNNGTITDVARNEGALEELEIFEKIIRSHMDEVPDINVGEWIPVGERLPETSKMVLVIVHSSEWISDYYSDWISEEEKIYHKEEYRTFCGHINESGEWVFFDEEMSEVHSSEEFGRDKSVVYDVVTHWKPLPEPYKEESKNDEM